MEWQEVESSNIEKIAWEDNVLQVQFKKNSRRYSYTPVSKEVYEELLNADSVGSVFWEKIRNNPNITAEEV